MAADRSGYPGGYGFASSVRSASLRSFAAFKRSRIWSNTNARAALTACQGAFKFLPSQYTAGSHPAAEAKSKESTRNSATRRILPFVVCRRNWLSSVMASSFAT